MNKALAKRKLVKVSRLLAEICDLTERDGMTVRFDRIAPSYASTPTIPSPSHTPARYPDAPLPLPKPGRRCVNSEFMHDALSQEQERREVSARKWCETSNHFPAIHSTPGSLVDPKIEHHHDCASHHAAKDCDCGRLFLLRIKGHAFVIKDDGSLERYAEAESTVSDFMADEMKFWGRHAWNVREWAIPAMTLSHEFSEVDDHFWNGMPTEFKAATKDECD